MRLVRECLAFLLAVFLSATGCTDHQFLSNTCSVRDPMEDLPWLRQMIPSPGQSLENSWFIQQGTYEGKTVFVFNICCAYCNYVTPVYNCSGERILDNLYVQGSAEPLVSNLVTIAKAEDFTCMP